MSCHGSHPTFYDITLLFMLSVYVRKKRNNGHAGELRIIPEFCLFTFGIWCQLWGMGWVPPGPETSPIGFNSFSNVECRQWSVRNSHINPGGPAGPHGEFIVYRSGVCFPEPLPRDPSRRASINEHYFAKLHHAARKHLEILWKKADVGCWRIMAWSVPTSYHNSPQKRNVDSSSEFRVKNS